MHLATLIQNKSLNKYLELKKKLLDLIDFYAVRLSKNAVN